MAQNPAFYIIQSPLLLPFIFGESDDIPEFYTANNPLNGELGELERALKSKAIHFSQMDAWLDFARTCNISLGMRIHGTMMPIQAGVPSVLIVHDSRTSGLANTMGIPWSTPDDYISNYSRSPAHLSGFIADRMAG
jgi:polysaccharide pyruvyl transferase WcaK-like protein